MFVNDMKYYTLSIVLNQSRDKVLMCWHEERKAYSFIQGSIGEHECKKNASYHNLAEETGITRADITLFTVREEIVHANRDLYKSDWLMYVTYGVLNKDVVLKEEKNRLEWVPILDNRIDLKSMGYGICRFYLCEVLALLRTD